MCMSKGLANADVNNWTLIIHNLYIIHNEMEWMYNEKGWILVCFETRKHSIALQSVPNVSYGRSKFDLELLTKRTSPGWVLLPLYIIVINFVVSLTVYISTFFLLHLSYSLINYYPKKNHFRDLVLSIDVIMYE